MFDRCTVGQLSLAKALEQELATSNRLLPPRWDYLALSARIDQVEDALRPLLLRGATGGKADVVFCNKRGGGARPLHVMSLADRVLYRALVDKIAARLPTHLQQRESFALFERAPLDHPGVSHISLTDVAAYYEFVDHVVLADELIGQTGEKPTVELLLELLNGVMGRRVGLPQVHPASDRLGDTYIDRARRRLLRGGYATWSYSDDFRFASTSLGHSRAALEACSHEVRELGLVLSERKTFTYTVHRYQESLTSFADAERRLLPEGATSVGSITNRYECEAQAPAPHAIPFNQGLEADESQPGVQSPLTDHLVAAAKVFEAWVKKFESGNIQPRQDAAIWQSWLDLALPVLGEGGATAPLKYLERILSSEPSLTPEAMAYLTNLDAHPERRSQLRSALDDLVGKDIYSPWQQMWLAHAAGTIGPSRTRHRYEDWLAECVRSSVHKGLAATAAASLGRIGRGDSGLVMRAIDRVGSAWHTLAFWGLTRLDRDASSRVAEDMLDQLLLEATEPAPLSATRRHQ